MPNYDDFTKLENATGPLPDLRAIDFRVPDEDDGATVAYVLRHRLLMSRRSVTHAKFLANGIMLDGQHVRTNAHVHAGQVIRVVVGDEPELVEASSVEPVAAPPGMLNILYEDEDVLVLNKPAGLTMHPAKGYEGKSLSNYLMAHLEAQGRPSRAHIVNRLDKGTSGLMVCATNAHAKWVLQRSLHSPSLPGYSFTRAYVAICHGRFEEHAGTIDAPMARIMHSPCIMAVAEGPEWSKPDKPAVLEARTHYEVLGCGNTTGGEEVSLVRFVLDTGRTHQIRVHASYVGHPLVGDRLYGGTTELMSRPALHSVELDFTHPVTRDQMHFTAPVPQDMTAVLTACGIAVS